MKRKSADSHHTRFLTLDRLFVAVLYTSDSDKIMRYTDEGETIELCRWTVDLGTLPSFQQHANNPQPGGFYTDFELGLELDSAGESRLVFNILGFDPILTFACRGAGCLAL